MGLKLTGRNGTSGLALWFLCSADIPGNPGVLGCIEGIGILTLEVYHFGYGGDVTYPDHRPHGQMGVVMEIYVYIYIYVNYWITLKVNILTCEA